MKKTIIIFSAYAIIAGACGQSNTKQQTKENIINAETLVVVNDTDSTNEQSMIDNESFDIQRIDSVKYFALKEKTNIQKVELEKITDLEQAKLYYQITLK